MDMDMDMPCLLHVSVGSIRTPSGFEPVVGFLHADAHVRPSYHVLTTTDGASIAISWAAWALIRAPSVP